jgi:GTPase SAR1 family protein
MIIVNNIKISHIRNADGAILIYDISSESSFNQLDFWYEAIKKATSDDIVIYLVGIKTFNI